jgi:hypothetical protein
MQLRLLKLPVWLHCKELAQPQALAQLQALAYLAQLAT